MHPFTPGKWTSIRGFTRDISQQELHVMYLFYLFCIFNRTYLTTDVMRRVMTQMFGIDVVLVMGITDIDDKIIRRANEVHPQI